MFGRLDEGGLVFKMFPSAEFMSKYNIRPEAPAISVKVYPTIIHAHKVLPTFIPHTLDIDSAEKANRAVEHLRRFQHNTRAWMRYYREASPPNLMDRNLRGYRVEFTVSFSSFPSPSDLEQLHADLMIAITNLASFPLMVCSLSFRHLRDKQKTYLQKACKQAFHQRTIKLQDGSKGTELDPVSVIRLTMIRSMFGIADEFTSRHLRQLPLDILAGTTDIFSEEWQRRMKELQAKHLEQQRNMHRMKEWRLTLKDCNYDRELFTVCKKLFDDKLICFQWAPGRPGVEPTFVIPMTRYRKRSPPSACPKQLLIWAAKRWRVSKLMKNLFLKGATPLEVNMTFEQL